MPSIMVPYRWALVSGLIAKAIAQESGWKPNQVNATMCRWEHPRVGVIRDTLYIDGGNLWYTPGMSNGQFGESTSDNMPDALVYEFDFGTALSFSENVTQKLTSRSKSGGSASNIAPQYYDGAMFTNDYQWLLYGGLLQITDSADPPPANSYVTYEKYDNGGPGRRFDAEDGQIDFATTDGNVTRYIAFGGSASAPSENKGWYFSGMMAKGKGELFAPYGNDTTDPTVFANSLITVDMSQLDEKFTNTTLPSEVTPRISPELVFVPVGQNGILAVIGGVTDSYVLYATPRLNATQLANSQTASPNFLSTIPIYDIATGEWYLQETSGTPPPAPLSEFCSVVASAPDGSSHNIYMYGGTSGYSKIDPTNFYDDVYVLSLPTFTWIPVALSPYQPEPDAINKGRAGHKCVKPWVDTMLVVGGYPAETGSGGGGPSCLPSSEGAGILRGFSLNKLIWEETYSPNDAAHDESYQVPEVIFAEIGGNSIGGARTSPANWSDTALAAVFSVRYDQSKLIDYSPYDTTDVGEPDPTRPDAPPEEEDEGSGTPRWLAPVLGTVLGLVFVTALAVAVILYRRRRMFHRRQSEAGTSEVARNRIMSWVKNGGLPDPKSPTVTSDSASHREGDDSDYGVSSSGHTRVRSATNFTERSMSPLSHSRQYSDGSIHASEPIQEAGGTMIYEMDATDRAQEMSAIESGIGFSFVNPRSSGLKHSQSVQSNSTVVSEGSDAISPSEDGTGTWGSDGVMSPSTPRPDSPTEGTSSNPGSARWTPQSGAALSPATAEGSNGERVRRKSAFGEHFDDK